MIRKKMLPNVPLPMPTNVDSKSMKKCEKYDSALDWH
jgi:hypothetical protein